MTAPTKGTRVWLTGATSGIGEALALELADRGATVIASGRTMSALLALQAQYPDNIVPLAVDVGDKEAVANAAQEIDQRFGALDCAILNAGICEYVDVQDIDSDLFERVMHVNFMGTVYCIDAALPLLRKGNSPHLVGMSSTAAYAGLPRAEAYGASKAAVRYLFQSLDVDMSGEEVDVSVILPGFVKTPLTDKNDFPMPMRITVDEAVAAIIKGLEKRQREIAFPFSFALGLRIAARLPDALRTKLFARMVT